MDIYNKFNFYVGTSRGTLLFNGDKPNDIKSAKTQEASEVTALVFGKDEQELLIGYENGSVNVYNTAENKYLKTLQLEGEGRVVGIGCTNDSVVIGRHDGIINVWNGSDYDYIDIHLDEKGTLDALECNPYRQNIIGTGGEINDLKLWDIETHKCVFKAKSLGHDMLNLPIPTSLRGIVFFPGDSHLSGCATKEGHVLLYDDRAQRRPIVKFFEKKASYSAISCAYRERQCLVGTTRGYMQVLDLKVGKCLRTFTSFTGSITSIACDPVEPYVVSTSLDRHLRIHNLETKELLHKVYLKQNLTKVVIKPVVKDEPAEEAVNENENIDEEYEEIFQNMQTVVSEKKLKKGKRKGEDVADKPRKSKKKKAKES
ncbi:hypothetical protein NQ315_006860 [Exocentrus adspersus]|uniref:WD repeat-containing protein 74 n=1 Tax=Exocentrus adspersus TaxID=1586481 RepID=A0AAV8WC28_9CUCU|nr:hypothetical protein NQ315_006860 [Exocentrus adspersus]